MCLVNYEIIKIVWFESVEVECDALDTAAKNISIRLLYRIDILAYIDVFPKLFLFLFQV